MTFPNRPDHHDFIRLSAVVIEGDDGAEPHAGTGLSIPELMENVADLESVLYMAEGRMKLMCSRLGMRPLPQVRTAMLALWLDAFRAGVRFQQEGGHTDE